MSLLSIQFLINLLIIIVISAGLFFYVRQRFQILEHSQMEQAKILQSIIGTVQRNQLNLAKLFSNRNHIPMNGNMDINECEYNSNEDNLHDYNCNDGDKCRRNVNNLIEVSEDDDEESDNNSSCNSDEETDSSDSDSSSQSDDSSDNDDDDDDDSQPKHKIIDISNALEHHNIIEHINGNDIKVVELDSNALTLKSHKEDNNESDDNNDNEDESQDDSSEDDSEDESSSESNHSTSDNEEHDIEIQDIQIESLPEIDIEVHKLQHDVVVENDNVISNNTHNDDKNDEKNDEKNENESNVKSDSHSLDNNLDQYKDVPLKNVPVTILRQMLKNKPKQPGQRLSDSAINKMSKKELIEFLSN